MRILHCLSRSSLGGGQVVVYSLMKAVRDLNPAVTQGVALPSGGPFVERFRQAGFETFEVPFTSIFLSSSTVRKLIADFGPDIVHSHEWWAGLHVRRSIDSASSYRTFHSYHGFHSVGSALLRKPMLALENALTARTNGVLCLSESEANEVHRHIAASRGKNQVIQNSIDTDRVRKDGEEPLPAELAAWFDRNASRRVLAMIARPTPIKNHDLAFSAVEIVLNGNSGYAFLFVGLPPSDRRYRRLKKRFGAHVLAVPYLANIAPVIRRSWLLLLSSKREACPLVVLEGFALGIPTIGTKTPGIVDVVQDKWNGFLMDPVPDALASILRTLDQDRALYENARLGAREQGGYLRMREWARQYMDVYARKPVPTSPPS